MNKGRSGSTRRRAIEGTRVANRETIYLPRPIRRGDVAVAAAGVPRDRQTGRRRTSRRGGGGRSVLVVVVAVVAGVDGGDVDAGEALEGGEEGGDDGGADPAGDLVDGAAGAAAVAAVVPVVAGAGAGVVVGAVCHFGRCVRREGAA